MYMVYTEYGTLFTAEQKVFEIAGMRIGGQPGENPAILIGSVFYRGDKALINPETGDIDREKARRDIESAKSLIEDLGLYFALDVILPSVKSVEKIIPFVAELDTVILIDALDHETRIRAYEIVHELGIERRSIANGIYIDTDDRELEVLRSSGIEAAILLAFDPRNPSVSMKPRERVRIVKEVLLPKAEKAGVRVPLVDMVVLDPASIALSAAAIALVKNELGLPAGCAPANALGRVSPRTTSVEEAVAIHSSIAAMLRSMGSDFIFYGPVKRAKYVAYAVAMVDSMLGYLAKHRKASIPANHPMKKYLRRVQQLFLEAK